MKNKYQASLSCIKYYCGHYNKAVEMAISNLQELVNKQKEWDRAYKSLIKERDKLIEEYFTPQPLKFEDLTPGMWVYDAPYEEIARIKEIESNEWIFLEYIKSNDLSNTFFQEERFYPIQIPNIGTE